MSFFFNILFGFSFFAHNWETWIERTQTEAKKKNLETHRHLEMSKIVKNKYWNYQECVFT